jgi:hypothetical protein
MPKPVLQAMVLADHIYRDAETGKFLIIGSFGIVFVRQNADTPQLESGKTEIEGETKTVPLSSVSSAGTPYLYLALTSVRGKTPLRLRYVDLSDSTVSLEANFEVDSSNPLGLVELSLPLPSLARPLGLYSLDLLYNGEILGSWRVTVRSPESPAVEDSK